MVIQVRYYGLGRHDGQGLRLQANSEYDRMNPVLDLFLKDEMDGELFRSGGKAFQIIGAKCFIDRESERLMYMSLLAPLVSWE